VSFVKSSRGLDNRRVARVTVTQAYDASVHEAEACWYDTGRWPEWVDGAARVLSVDATWPEAGSSVLWESVPAGRGRVRESVLDYEPRAGMRAAVEDDSIVGTQRVAFSPAGEGVAVELSLEYRIKRRTPITPVIEWLFVRRPMTLSMTKTLEHFGVILR
jgi:Polyketide cyclase / dehydrase and lipid transport